jgi:hypothetical protein
MAQITSTATSIGASILIAAIEARGQPLVSGQIQGGVSIGSSTSKRAKCGMDAATWFAANIDGYRDVCVLKSRNSGRQIGE